MEIIGTFQSFLGRLFSIEFQGQDLLNRFEKINSNFSIKMGADVPFQRNLGIMEHIETSRKVHTICDDAVIELTPGRGEDTEYVEYAKARLAEGLAKKALESGLIKTEIVEDQSTMFSNPWECRRIIATIDVVDPSKI